MKYDVHADERMWDLEGVAVMMQQVVVAPKRYWVCMACKVLEDEMEGGDAVWHFRAIALYGDQCLKSYTGQENPSDS